MRSKFHFQERKTYFVYGTILGIIAGIGNLPWHQPILMHTQIGVLISHMVIFALSGAITTGNLFFYINVDKMDMWGAAFRGMKWGGVGIVILLISLEFGLVFMER